MLALILKRYGLESKTCASIEEAKNTFQTNDFQLALVDLNLDGESGFDFIEFVRHQKRNIDIIIISAYDGNNEREMAENLNVDFFIKKPFNTSTLSKTLIKMGLIQ